MVDSFYLTMYNELVYYPEAFELPPLHYDKFRDIYIIENIRIAYISFQLWYIIRNKNIYFKNCVFTEQKTFNKCKIRIL